MDKAKLLEVIKEKKDELSPISVKLDELMDEENKLNDIIHDAQRRLKEIRGIVHDEKYKTNHRVKSEGLLSKASHLKHEIEALERIIN
tara:strand:- start:1172 stop:1435 length:264 start_codon:yes stop_codon:yes gene_type:complete